MFSGEEEMGKGKILIIDDDPSITRSLELAFVERGFEVITSNDGKKGLEKFEEGGVAIILTDLKMPGMDGIEILRKVKERSPETEVIIITGHADVPSAIQAMKLGAYDYISKPLNLDELEVLVERALERRQLVDENLNLKDQLKEKYRFENIVGNSPEMMELFKLVAKAASSSATILIQGESGTGKELVARAIHYNSPRKNGPFVTIDCGALAENLLESELFGHVKGAFTGALTTKKGLFTVANGGTIFLDEISETSKAFQVKLLRVLQERKFKMVGDTKELDVDLRFICATNKRLREEVEKGAFREDLFYRLSVVEINVPPLRNRKDDIPLLARHFLEKYKRRLNKEEIIGISDGAMECLISYDYPGNVRELEHIIERAVVLTEKNVITPNDLPERLRKLETGARREDYIEINFKGEFVRLDKLREAMEELEKELIQKALLRFNKTKVAEILGISLRDLHYKIYEKYKLKV
jgi:DNA-binding NtrC family response regulator